MKTPFAMIGLLLALLLGCTKTITVNPAIEQDQQHLAKPFFYQATHPQRAQAIFLLGTVHLGVDPQRLPAKVWQTIESVDHLVVEVDIEQIDQKDVIKYLFLPSGKRLSERLGQQEFEKLQQLLPQVPAEQLDRMQAAAIAPLLIQSSLKQQDTPMDQALVNHARHHQKPIISLETASQQLALLNRIYNESTLKDFLNQDSIEQIRQSVRDEFSKLVTAYIEGDAEELMALMLGNDKPLIQLNEADRKLMLDDRNADWLGQIKQFESNQSYLIAVGAGHLFQSYGLIELLKQDGFQVRRL